MTVPPLRNSSGSAILTGNESPLPFNRPSLFAAAMPLGINPLNDFAFMKTFGTPEGREPLIGLLNAVLEAEVADHRRDD